MASRPMRRHGAALMACFVGLLAVPLSFVGFTGVRPVRAPSPVLRHASGPVPADTRQKGHPQGYQRKLYKRMPNSNLDLREIMTRITTVLLKNMQEDFRDAPMKTVDLMKDIRLTGNQMKSKRFIIDALQLLQAQKVVYKVKQNPARWEIHEEFRKYGVPPISHSKRMPWTKTSLLRFTRQQKPKFGPAHGLYRPKDREWMKSRKYIPLQSIYDPIIKPDPYASENLNDLSLHYPKREALNPTVTQLLPKVPKDKHGKYVTFDADAADA